MIEYNNYKPLKKNSMKTFTSEQMKTASSFFKNYLSGDIDIENISQSDIQKNIALPSFFEVGFTTCGQEPKKKINIDKQTKIGDFDVIGNLGFNLSLAIFCYPKNHSLDAYPDPTELLKNFLPKWFESLPEENHLLFNMKDKETKKLTLQEVIDTFNSLGLEINQGILYNMEDPFEALFQIDKKKKFKIK